MKRFTFLLGLVFLFAFAYASYAAVDVTVLNETFVRGTGTPITETRTFPGVSGTAIIKLYNGSATDSTIEKVSSSIITVNGQVVFDSSNFSQNVSYLEKQITLNEGQNTIAVLLKSKPGGQVAIQIVQTIEAEAAAVVGHEGGAIGVAGGIQAILPVSALETPQVVTVVYYPTELLQFDPLLSSEVQIVKAVKFSIGTAILNDNADLAIPNDSLLGSDSIIHVAKVYRIGDVDFLHLVDTAKVLGDRIISQDPGEINSSGVYVFFTPKACGMRADSDVFTDNGRMDLPSCRERLNMYAYLLIGYSGFLKQDQRIAELKLNNLFDTMAFIKSAATAAGYIDTAVSVSGALNTGICAFTTVTPLISDYFATLDSFYGEPTSWDEIRTTLINFLSCYLCSATTGDISACTSTSVLEILNTSLNLQKITASWEFVKRLNEISIADAYLRKYYAFGGNISSVALSLGLNESATIDDIIDKIAETAVLEHILFYPDYSTENIRISINKITSTIHQVVSQVDPDYDGLVAEKDKCPDTPMGEQTDEDGCSISQKAPTVPVLEMPSNNATNIDPNNVSFTWSESTDPQGDTVQYCITVKDSSEIPVFAGCDNGDFRSDTSRSFINYFDYGKTYWWAAWAKDSNDYWSPASEWWSFTTMPNPNDVDNDGDGYSENQGDCNDSNPNIHPGATEICGDGIDQDCNGSDLACYADSDGDGIPDYLDNCPNTYNPDQADSNSDGIGDVCDNNFGYEVAIANPSFEYESLAEGNYISKISGWELSGFAGTWHPKVFSYPNGAPDGNNIAYVNSGTISQILPKILTAGDTYTLKVYVGKRADYQFGSYSIQLLAGGNVIAQENSLWPGNGEFLLSSVSYTVNADDYNLGLPLGIRLWGTTQVNFDKVSLFVTPEPQDTDADGIYDYADNCLHIYNPNQADSDGDGVGDACFDIVPMPMKYYDQFNTSRSKFSGPSLLGQPLTMTLPTSFPMDIWFPTLIGPNNTLYRTDGWPTFNLHSIAEDGSINWKYQFDQPGAISADGILYTNGGGTLAARDFNGNLKWTYKVPYTIKPPTIGLDGTIYFLNGYNLVTPHDYELFALNPDGTLKFRYMINEFFREYEKSLAVDTDGTVYIVTFLGNLFAIKDGTLLWKIQRWEWNPFGYSPAIGTDGTIYVSLKGGIAAINKDGTIKWEKYSCQSGCQFATPKIGTDGTIYANIQGGMTVAFSPNGTVKWTKDIDIHSIGSNGIMYGYKGSNIAVFDKDGNVLSLGPEKPGGTVLIGTNGIIFVPIKNTGEILKFFP